MIDHLAASGSRRLNPAGRAPRHPMINIHRIISLDHAGLEPYRTLRRPLEHRQQGIFVAEGEKVVRRLLDSTLRLRSVLLCPEWFERFGPALNSGHQGPVDVFLADRALLRQIIGYNLHQGIMALAEVPPEPDLRSLPSAHVVVALDALHHAENVGVVVRNAAALGAHAILAGETAASPYLRRAVRNSMGAVFHLPIFHPPSLSTLLRSLVESWGTRLIAADAGGTTLLEEAEFGGNVCVIVGNEQEGVSPELLSLCAVRVRVPMERGTDSLNVGSALAVILYGIREYRRRTGEHHLR